MGAPLNMSEMTQPAKACISDRFLSGPIGLTEVAEVQIDESFYFFQNKQFYDQKYQQNLKSKNGLKSPLRALNKELWAI